VVEHVYLKMVRRHPHVFGDVSVETAQDVRENWEQIKAGEKVDLDLTYAVLTTSDEMARVREIREIWIGDNQFGNPETTVERKGGTYQSNIPIFLPKDAQKGTYKVRYIVQTDYSKDTRETSFTVY
jgi:hypothetical protein